MDPTCPNSPKLVRTRPVLAAFTQAHKVISAAFEDPVSRPVSRNASDLSTPVFHDGEYGKRLCAGNDLGSKRKLIVSVLKSRV